MKRLDAPVVPAESQLILLRLGEVWLKGRNQSIFLEQLRTRLSERLTQTVGPVQIKFGRGRLYIRIENAKHLATAVRVCADTPGITSVSPVLEVEADVDAIVDGAERIATQCWAGTSTRFAVKAKRTDKRFPTPSSEINRQVGYRIQQALGLDVDLTNPAGTVGVEINTDTAHIWVQIIDGVGGLPLGSAGKILLLLSGGIDSPVAGYLAQKRGCRLEAIYFHSPPFISDASKDKVEQLARKLAPRQGFLRLHVIPFTAIQKAIKADCDPRFTVILYRRFMYRIADTIAQATGSIALCTGENLAQVASQTLQNLTVVDTLTSRLTLRPVITFDKDEIVRIARQIDTFDTSVLPHDDCCTLFVPKHPITKARLIDAEDAETPLLVEQLVADAVSQREVIDIEG